jgi:hypothetical protein
MANDAQYKPRQELVLSEEKLICHSLLSRYQLETGAERALFMIACSRRKNRYTTSSMTPGSSVIHLYCSRIWVGLDNPLFLSAIAIPARPPHYDLG